MRRYLPDLLLALAVVALGLGGNAGAAANQGLAAAWWSYPLAVGVGSALAVRRRWPYPVLAVAALGTGTHLALGGAFGPILVGLAVAVYTVAAHRPWRPALVAAGSALLVVLAHLVFRGDADPVVPMTAWLTVPFAVGFAVRTGRENAARTRADDARRIADAERLQVAQEVHDVVGHGLSAITMQAEIALHLIGKRPEQAEAALTAIAKAGHDSLAELKATLSAVRDPLAGVARLDELADRVRHGGVPVDVEVRGTPEHLPAAVDLAAYRIVQESLTNVLRHAGAARATVRLSYDDGALEVSVTDDGRGGESGDGHGIAGMRSRVAALGGTFAAGPGDGGGFRVRATLPVGPA